MRRYTTPAAEGRLGSAHEALSPAADPLVSRAMDPRRARRRCDVQPVDVFAGDGRKPEYQQAVHPHGFVPALEDDGVVLIESSAICMYLADRYGDGRLAPKVGTIERGKYYEWMVYVPGDGRPVPRDDHVPHHVPPGGEAHPAARRPREEDVELEDRAALHGAPLARRPSSSARPSRPPTSSPAARSHGRRWPACSATTLRSSATSMRSPRGPRSSKRTADSEPAEGSTQRVDECATAVGAS